MIMTSPTRWPTVLPKMHPLDLLQIVERAIQPSQSPYRWPRYSTSTPWPPVLGEDERNLGTPQTPAASRCTITANLRRGALHPPGTPPSPRQGRVPTPLCGHSSQKTCRFQLSGNIRQVEFFQFPSRLPAGDGVPPLQLVVFPLDSLELRPVQLSSPSWTRGCHRGRAPASPD